MKPEIVQCDWFAVDAVDQTLSRLTTEITRRLRDKYKPEYIPHIDTGDYIAVISAEQVYMIGVKTTDKIYYHHSDFPGGTKPINFEKLIAEAPERVIETVVRDTLPKNPPGRDIYHKLKVYRGASRPHTAQQP